MISTLLAFTAALTPAPVDTRFRDAARGLDRVVEQRYAYLDALPDGRLPESDALTQERERVADRDTLLRYAEHRLTSLADHHAITRSAFRDSWALVPSYADLWVSAKGGAFVIDAVRDGSPAARAAIQPGDRLIAVDGVAASVAVERFWSALGLAATPTRIDHAVRVLAAGRRDRDRQLSIADGKGQVRELTLASLYAEPRANRPPVDVETEVSGAAARSMTIRINDSLGEAATIVTFDAAMARIPPNTPLIIDLRDTPSGGNTSVARAILGWFVDRPRSYQVHNSPYEERATGVARQWIEQVLPRVGKYRRRLPTIRVGRWTGSMGEGLAIGFAAIGARVRGGAMAGLKGAVEDIMLGDTGVGIKLPTERLLTTTGQPREAFVAPER